MCVYTYKFIIYKYMYIYTHIFYIYKGWSDFTLEGLEILLVRWS